MRCVKELREGRNESMKTVAWEGEKATSATATVIVMAKVFLSAGESRWVCRKIDIKPLGGLVRESRHDL